MNRLTDEQIDMVIKDKFRQDNTISKQADMVFKNFNPSKITTEKTNTSEPRNNVYTVKKTLTFYQKMNRILSVAAVSLSVILVSGTAIYFNKDGKNNQTQIITYNQNYLVKNEKLNVSNEQIMKEIENSFIKVYLTGKKDVGINLTSTYWDEFEGEFTSTDCYKIDNIDKPVADIFIGEIGGRGLPYVFLLMEDGTIEYVDLHCFYDNSFYYEAKSLEGLDNVVGFEQKTRKFSYSDTDYNYVNAIRKDGLRKEIEIGVLNNWTDTVIEEYDKQNEKYVKAHNGEAIPDDGKGDFEVDGATYIRKDNDLYCYKGEFMNKALYKVDEKTGEMECLVSGLVAIVTSDEERKISVYVNDNNIYFVFKIDNNVSIRHSTDNSLITETTTETVNRERENNKQTENTEQTENNEQQVSQNIQTGSENITVLKGNSYKKEILVDDELTTKEIYTVTFDEEGKPTIKVGYQNQNKTEVYFQTTEIYNVVGDAAAGSVYVDFYFKAFTPSGDVTGSGSIRYSNVTDNEQIGVKAYLNIEGDPKDFDNDGDYIYVTKIDE
ncbi:MAG: hypothetical protein K6B70_03115 [Clostridia bacterium]|nr:hypothetical protein [Clostridia bacterium]